MYFNKEAFVISSLLCFIFALLFLKSRFSSKPHKNLPPSPPSFPLVGHLHQLGSSPHRALQAMAQTYGPLMLLRLGTVPVLVASSVDAAREIMKTHDLNFSNRPESKIRTKFFYGPKDIAFVQYGDYWRQVRSIAMVHLLSNKRVQSFRQVRKDEITLLIRKIQETHGSIVNLSELLISLTNNVVCRVALGRTYERKKFKDLLERFMKLMGTFAVGNYIPLLAWVDHLTGLEQKANEVAKEVDDFLEGVIEEHVKRKRDGFRGQDLVDILLETESDGTRSFHLERDAIKAVILDIFAGGTDTTFTTLEWAICELLRHPQTMKILQQEARETGQGRSMIIEEELDKMHYLKAVLKESIRLHPPVPLLLPRESTNDIKVLGYDITAGTQVIINAWAISKDHSVWKEPDRFMPERFLNNPIDYNGLHFELIPFGAGRRGCPGIQFSSVVNELVLANLVYKFDFAANEEELDLSEVDGLTIHKKNPLHVVATPYGP